MRFGLKNNSKNIFRDVIVGLLTAIVLSACGGGGGSAGAPFQSGETGTGTATSKSKITVALVDQSGNPANLISGATQLTVKVKVLDSKGLPANDALVKFSVGDATLVVVSPTTDLTDTNGSANGTVIAASQSAVGATTITVEATVKDPANPTKNIVLSGSVNLKVGAAPQAAPSAVELVSYVPTDRSILIKGNVGSNRNQSAQVTFKVVGNGQPIANQKVKFAFEPANADLTFVSDSGVTGQSGEVTAIVNSGATVTIAAVKITVLDASGNPTAIVATSDQISVTNDTTSINGISFSVDQYYFEALNVDGKFAVITARLTDKQGGQVTDGTVVTFTTDGGAITGLNNSAMCQTTDGACSVKLVGQNPRPASGIATVIGSVRVDGVLLQSKIRIVMSGSSASFTGNFNIDATTNCSPQIVTFNLADQNGNPLPEGSNLSILDSQNVTAKIIGDTVKYAFSIPQGTTHQVQITPGGDCVVGGASSVSGSATILLKTPYGIESTQVVTVDYKAS